MKNLLLLVLLLLVQPCFPQSIPVNAEALPAHPRILLFDGEETLVHQTIASAPIWKEIHQTILDWSDTLLLKKPVDRVLTGKRLLDRARECLLRVCYLSYSWRMTNDDKYFKRAEKEMLAAASFTDWNPDHFLDVSEFTMALSIGYDWLYKKLPENSRLLIRKAIIEKGLKPSLIGRYNGWLLRSNNWNQVCNAGMAYGALAVYESDPDLSKQIIERAIRSLTLPMGEYNPDGAYNEGYGYWGYGTTFNVMFLSAIEKVFKTDFGLLKNEGFFKTAGYMNNMLGTSGQPFNYSDCTSGVEIHPAMFWFAKILNDNSLLWNEIKLAEPEIKSRYKFLPVLLIWGSGMDLNNIPAPKEKIWVGRGKNPVALMRTSWIDPDAVFVGIKGGTCQAGHSHMDAGSFVMDADGVRWAMDFGPQGYNSLESKGVDLWNSKQNSQRWQVFRYNNFVHNTLTVNNEFQSVDGYAPLVRSSASGNFMNAVFDLSEIYKGQLEQVNRGIAIVDKQYVVVRDEMVVPGKETLVRWTLLTSANVKIIDNHTAELTKNGKKLILKVREPAQIVLRTWPTTPANAYDEPNPGTSLVGFETKLSAKATAAFTVFLIPEKAAGATIRKIQSLNKWDQ